MRYFLKKLHSWKKNSWTPVATNFNSTRISQWWPSWNQVKVWQIFLYINACISPSWNRDFSKLLHIFLALCQPVVLTQQSQVIKWLCQSSYTDLSKLLHAFLAHCQTKQSQSMTKIYPSMFNHCYVKSVLWCGRGYESWGLRRGWLIFRIGDLVKAVKSWVSSAFGNVYNMCIFLRLARICPS